VYSSTDIIRNRSW